MNKKDISIENQQFFEVLTQIQTAKQHAFQQVNKTLVQLYWNIGSYISKQAKTDNWGKGTVEQLATFIKQREPNISGFTARNIWRMKRFYETYRENEKLSTLWAEIPWSHNHQIFTLKTLEEWEFYLLLYNQKKYSYRELERLITSGTYERIMLADKKLATLGRELYQTTNGVFKNTYVFEFLDLPKTYKEKDLQQALVHN